MVVGIDLDGVLYNFHDALREWIHANQGIDKDKMQDPVHWSWSSWGWPVNPTIEICDVATDSGFLFVYGNPYTDAVETIREIRSRLHHVHIITARNFGTKSIANTSDWLNLHGIEYDSITFTEDKNQVNVDILFDDHVDNVLKCNLAGKRGVLVSQPWNEYATGLERVKSWKEILELLG